MRAIHYLAAAGAFVAMPAVAKPLVTEQFKANAEIAMDPAKAYILVRAAGMDLKLLRVATEAERATWNSERAEALAKAREKYAKEDARYQRDFKYWQDSGDHGMNTLKPEKPIEPTDANFNYKALESDNFVTVWGGRVFDKGGPKTAHLIAVPPGTYRLYGQIFEAGGTGFCLCMGSVQFDAAAGAITDMGTMRYPKAEALKDKVDPSWNGLTPGKGGLTIMRVEPADAETYIPPKLASLPRVAANYRAAGKIDNFFGVTIDRLTALSGVLAYRRDEVIDEKTGSAIGSN
jgi:hypothetical protein